MAEYTFGANILGIITTGMYKDSKVIYREYIQNACDSIDAAVKGGLLKQGDGRIQIWLNQETRSITIEDNGTGIKAADFVRIMGNIAEANKKYGEAKGFKGIGRLFGLAYCEKLIFTTSFTGETVKSVISCDAQTMRDMLSQNLQTNKYSANEVLNAINNFSSEEEKAEEHYFRVELANISVSDKTLLNEEETRDFLSFVAPVPYQNTFYYRNDVYEHAKMLGFDIDEYNVTLEGQQIFKKYVTDIKEANGKKCDDIHAVDFFDLRDDNGNLLAWMWFGLSRFDGVIPEKANPMRCIRVRTGNIQIGDEETLRDYWPEASKRGNGYFIGELFSVSKDLVPNAHRDWFEQNPARVELEEVLRKKFRELWKLCHDASEANSTNKKIASLAEQQKAFDEKQQQGHFAGNKEEEQKERDRLTKARQEVDERLEKQWKRLDALPKGSIAEQVLSRIVGNTPAPQPTEPSALPESPSDPLAWLRSQLPRRDRAELKLLNRIFSIIRSNADKETSDLLIGKIIDGLK